MRTMPDDARVSYEMPSKEGPIVRTLERSALLEKLQQLATCNDKVRCSIQEKGRLLQTLENYYANGSSAETRAAAHRYRYCAATLAAEATAVNDPFSMEIDRRTAIDRMLLER
jgi:hypothetical protein